MCWDGTVVCCQEDDKMFIYFLWVTTSHQWRLGTGQGEAAQIRR